MNGNQKGFANIILIVIVILVGAVGYFVFVKKSEPVVQQPTPVQTKISVSPTPTPKNGLVNWKTYTNNRVGYQIEYPTSGLQLDLNETTKYPSTYPNSTKEDLVQFTTATMAYSIETTVGGSIDGCVWGTNFVPTTIGNVSGYKSSKTLEACVVHGGNLYAIIARDGTAPSNNLNDSIYLHLLSTFKFTK